MCFTVTWGAWRLFGRGLPRFRAGTQASGLGAGRLWVPDGGGTRDPGAGPALRLAVFPQGPLFPQPLWAARLGELTGLLGRRWGRAPMGVVAQGAAAGVWCPGNRPLFPQARRCAGSTAARPGGPGAAGLGARRSRSTPVSQGVWASPPAGVFQALEMKTAYSI